MLGKRNACLRLQSLKIKIAEKETWKGALKDNDPNSMILFDLIEKTAQLPDHLPVHQVHGRMVNGHKADTLLSADMEILIILVTHDISSSKKA